MSEQAILSWQRTAYSVGELNALVRTVLDREIGFVWVAGELSGFKLAPSGHAYFNLRDRDATLRCVCFRNSLRLLRFRPQDGLSVLARGRIDVYEPRGEYQLVIEVMEPQGHGALQLAFEQLKRRLGAEGLFEASRKRPLPKLPQRIGLITSPRGAVIQDMLQILERRHPGLHIRLYPVIVQGEGSAAQIAEALREFPRDGWPDVLILARGGGSIEDLWSFNEEIVARAIAASPVPVISAVGHETDYTIADFVADLRAPTPSAAAELVICTRQSLLDRVAQCERVLEERTMARLNRLARRLHEQGVSRVQMVLQRSLGRRMQRADDLDYRVRNAMRTALAARERRLQNLTARLQALDLRVRLVGAHRRLDAAHARLHTLIAQTLQQARRHVDRNSTALKQLSPLNILERGYAIVETEDHHVVTSYAEAPAKSKVSIRLAQGRLKAKVTDATPGDNSALLW